MAKRMCFSLFLSLLLRDRSGLADGVADYNPGEVLRPDTAREGLSVDVQDPRSLCVCAGVAAGRCETDQVCAV